MPQKLRYGLQVLSQKLPQQNVMMRRLSKAFRYAGLEKNERLCSYFYWLEPKWLHKILNPAILVELETYSPADPLLVTLGNLRDEILPLDRMLFLEMKHFLADHNLNYTDKMGMATGVEIRVPLLDLDLVEFAINLPLKYKQRGKEGKWVFKKAMETMLPKDIIYRPKSGFGAPLRCWLHNELREVVDDILSPSNLKKRNLFNHVGVQELFMQDRKGYIDAAYPIFAILCIEMWCNLFIGKQQKY